MEIHRVNADVLVIGSGGAGLLAASRAKQAGADVLVIDKALIGRGGATVEAAAVAATGPWSASGDGVDVHFKDTVAGGKLINNQLLVRKMVTEIGDRVRELETMGLYFDKDPSGKYVLDIGGGHTYPRLLWVTPGWVGLQIVKVLWKRMLQLGVRLRPYTHVTRLLVRDGAAVGAIGVDFRSGTILAVAARSIVLATGGIGQLYPVTTNPRNSTGDGIVLALEAGVRLVNMEQVQFYPACVVYPESVKGVGLGVLEYSKLYNAQMERFMTRYEPGRLESTTRDLVARAIFTEIKEGRGTSHSGVYLDAREVSEKDFTPYVPEYEICHRWGVDLKHELVEVAPGAHYFMGGVEIDERCRTSIAHLYAAGEVAGGLHGANRLNGNSIADVLVFGVIAGEEAAADALRSDLVPVPDEQERRETTRIANLLDRGERPMRSVQLREKLRELMWRNVSLIRTTRDLEKTVAALRALRENEITQVSIESERLRWNNELRDYLELEAMIGVSECIVHAALTRRESRGAHHISEYPTQDDVAWMKNTVTTKTGSGITTSTGVVARLDAPS